MALNLGVVATRVLKKLPFGASRTGNTAKPTINLSTLTNGSDAIDWRTRLTVSPTVSSLLLQGDVLSPLAATGGIIFPYTPSIVLQQSAAYSGSSLAHSNYSHPSFEMHMVGEISISGQFSANSNADADYLRATMHFLRTVTKMFFGQDTTPIAGTPPPILRLNSHGDYILKNIPVVITAFTIDFASTVDYIRTTDGKSRLPTSSTISVVVNPAYSRAATANRFSLRDFADGKLLGTKSKGGFI